MLALLITLLFAAPGFAPSDLSSVGRALRSDPVYVDSSAELADAVDADKLREKLRDSGAAPMYIAVLPASAGAPNDVLKALHDDVGTRATYAVIVGNGFRAGSDLYPAGADATAARQESDTP